MPLPKPEPNEKQPDFIARCMRNSVVRREFPDQKQRAAVCYQTWRDKDKKKNENVRR